MAGETLSQMIERVRPSVVLIRKVSGGHGTGVIFNADGQYGYIVTNRHVVGDDREVMVTVNDSSPRKGLVMGSDDIYDLAFVKIAGRDLRATPFGDSSRVNAGAEVVAIGYPFHYQGEPIATKGIVSAIQYDSRHRSDVIMSDVTINPGNSGGPMLSLNGEILGINTFMSGNKQGNKYSFAIPESSVRTFASRLSVPIPPPRPQPSRPANTPPQQPRPAQQSQPPPQPRPTTQPQPAQQTRPTSQASASPSRLGTYLKVFGVGFVAGGILGVAVANFALGIKGDLSASLIISGLVGGSLALLVRMKIR